MGRRNRTNTAFEQMKDFLMQGRRLNSLVAEKEFGIKHNTCCYYIWKMRQEGYDIKTIKKQSYTGRDYAEYRLVAIPEGVQKCNTQENTNSK